MSHIQTSVCLVNMQNYLQIQKVHLEYFLIFQISNFQLGNFSKLRKGVVDRIEVDRENYVEFATLSLISREQLLSLKVIAKRMHFGNKVYIFA